MPVVRDPPAETPALLDPGFPRGDHLSFDGFLSLLRISAVND
jgi:hypothetical protein